MNKLIMTLITMAVLAVGTVAVTGNTYAATCELVDPINGTINITCKNAHLTISENGTRYLPLAQNVALRTALRVDWAQPFSGNTWLASWDEVNQVSQYWEKVGGVWVTNPINFVLQENGSTPWVELEVKRMPNGKRGWAIKERNDLLLWNGGN